VASPAYGKTNMQKSREMEERAKSAALTRNIIIGVCAALLLVVAIFAVVKEVNAPQETVRDMSKIHFARDSASDKGR
jgi:hypothetical protein